MHDTSIVFAGLHYLNAQKQRVIHYDLKPLMDESADPLSGMELTSQGAGTYW
ncbi:hypothetical protein T492DRAFT_894870 [Pavlovales sp. CCMP2436]|nr:hypothetical protein T492DRAFT_894870 [Pavlovales sp. CCMP2436]